MSGVGTTGAPDADEVENSSLADLPLDLLLKCMGSELWDDLPAWAAATRAQVEQMRAFITEDVLSTLEYFAGHRRGTLESYRARITHFAHKMGEDMACDDLAMQLVPRVPRGVCHGFEAVAAQVRRQLPGRCAHLHALLADTAPGHEFAKLPFSMLRRVTSVDAALTPYPYFALSPRPCTEYMHLYLASEFPRLQRLFVGLRKSAVASGKRQASQHKKRQRTESELGEYTSHTPRVSRELHKKARGFVEAWENAGPAFVELAQLAASRLRGDAPWLAPALEPTWLA